MTEQEARAWLEKHREQLETIVLTARLRRGGEYNTPGWIDADWALRQMNKNFMTVSALGVTSDAAFAIAAFRKWSGAND